MDEWPTGTAGLDVLADLFRVHRETIRQLILSGDFPGYQVGRCYRAKWAKVRDFITSQMTVGQNTSSTQNAASEVPLV